MIRRYFLFAAMAAFPTSTLFADFSYKETTTITGGAMMGMMNVVGAFSKQAKEPMNGEVAVRGNKMVHRNQNNSTIIDLDLQTLTAIDFQKKTYSVLTFDEMKRAIEEASRKMQKSDKAEATWKVSATATGNSRQISGYNAKELIMTVEMEVTDKDKGQKGGMVITTHIWLSGDVPGFSEIRDFQKRMAEKLDWAPSGNPFLSRPDIAKGMAEAYKEMARLDGTPVYQTMSMRADATPQDPGSQSAGPAPQPDQQQQAERPSVGGALGSALGGRFGLGRRKQQPKQQEAPAAESPAPTSPAGSLIDMTMEYREFSNGAVDSSLFSVPAGFKQVESDMKRLR